MEEEEGAGGGKDHVPEAPDMIPLNGEGPEGAPQSAAKPKGGARGRGRGRGGRGRGAKVGGSCPAAVYTVSTEQCHACAPLVESGSKAEALDLDDRGTCRA